MNDKQIFTLFRSLLLPAMQADTNLAEVELARNFQARQQGASSGPIVYYFKVSDRRYGHPKRRDVWNSTTGRFDSVDDQQYQSTIQFSAWIPQDPANVSGLTESDILNMVSGIMQSDAMLSAFRAAGVGILRIADVRNPYIVDERDRFEAVPTFDIDLTHTRTRATTTPAVVAYEANISRV